MTVRMKLHADVDDALSEGDEGTNEEAESRGDAGRGVGGGRAVGQSGEHERATGAKGSVDSGGSGAGDAAASKVRVVAGASRRV